MPKLNHLGADRLRKGRVSISGARYFVTICTKGRKDGLTHASVAEVLIEALRQMHRAGDIELRCATVMPDHIHTLFVLGSHLSLSQSQSKFKSITKQTLATAELCWQKNFFDHRLRYDVSMEQFSRYIFLNPYSKKLLNLDDAWPWWILSRNYRPEFVGLLHEQMFPHQEWLANPGSAKVLIENDSDD